MAGSHGKYSGPRASISSAYKVLTVELCCHYVGCSLTVLWGTTTTSTTTTTTTELLRLLPLLQLLPLTTMTATITPTTATTATKNGGIRDEKTAVR